MSHFRISLGATKYKKTDDITSLDFKVHELIQNKISDFKGLGFNKIAQLSEQSVAEYNIDDKVIQLTFYKKELSADEVLLVVQSAYKTFKFPNHLSWNFVGRMMVDGVVVSSANTFTTPEDSLLWEYT